MATIKSAQKAIRSQERKRVFNLRVRRNMASAVKEAMAALGKDRATQNTALSTAQKAIDKAVKRGIIKENTGSRKKSRLSARLKKSSA